GPRAGPIVLGHIDDLNGLARLGDLVSNLRSDLFPLSFHACAPKPTQRVTQEMQPVPFLLCSREAQELSTAVRHENVCSPRGAPVVGGWLAQAVGASRRSSAPCLIARCSFSKARTSIWRTRSREMPNSCERSSSVVGLSLSRRSTRIWRSRSLRSFIALSRRS